MATSSIDRNYILEDTPANREFYRKLTSESFGITGKVKRSNPPTEEQKQEFKRKVLKSIQKKLD